MTTLIKAKYGSVTVDYESGVSMSSLSIWSKSRGYERGSNFFNSDLFEKVEDLRTTYAWIKGEKSHYVRALDLLLAKIELKQEIVKTLAWDESVNA